LKRKSAKRTCKKAKKGERKREGEFIAKIST
jgi:hypothetical protein